MSSTFLTVFVCILAWLPTATSLSIDITPSKYTEASKGVVTVSCTLDASNVTNKTVLQLVLLGRGEKDLVTVRKGTDTIVYGTQASDRSKFQAKGSIPSDVSKSHLTLTISNPSQDDNGVYTCRLYDADEKGVLEQVEATGNLTVEIFDLHEIVKQLQIKVSDLETEIQGHTTKETQMMKTINDLQSANKPKQSDDDSELHVRMALLENNNVNLLQTATALSDKGSKLSDKIDILEKSTDNRINQLTDKDSELMEHLSLLSENARNTSLEITRIVEQDDITIAFSAGLGKTAHLTHKDVVVFDNVIMNVGGHYDVTTGNFTAPMPGLYVFYLSLRTSCVDCRSYANIKANDRNLVTLYTQDKYYQDQSAVSAVTLLGTGDVVTVEVMYEETNLFHWYKYCTFSGYLAH